MNSIYASEKLCQEIWPEYITRFANANTCEEYRATMDEFLEFYQKDFLQINSLGVAQRYLLYLEEKMNNNEITPGTMAKKYRQLHSVADYIVRNRSKYQISEEFEDYFSVYLSKLQPIAAMNQTVPIEDIDKLLQAAKENTMAYSIITMIYRMGLTSLEICDLKLTDFTVYDNLAALSVAGRSEPSYIPDDVYAILCEYFQERRDCTYLFYNREGAKLNKMYISRMLKKYCELAGIESYTANQIRNACGYTMTSYGVDAKQVSKQLGVARCSVTRFKDKMYKDESMKAANSLVQIKVLPPKNV